MFLLILLYINVNNKINISFMVSTILDFALNEEKYNSQFIKATDHEEWPSFFMLSCVSILSF